MVTANGNNQSARVDRRYKKITDDYARGMEKLSDEVSETYRQKKMIADQEEEKCAQSCDNIAGIIVKEASENLTQYGKIIGSITPKYSECKQDCTGKRNGFIAEYLESSNITYNSNVDGLKQKFQKALNIWLQKVKTRAHCRAKSVVIIDSVLYCKYKVHQSRGFKFDFLKAKTKKRDFNNICSEIIKILGSNHLARICQNEAIRES